MQKRKKVITGFFLFLVLMWVCTLISKSIYVAELPIVTTVTAESKYIEHIVEAEGVVEAGQKQAVIFLDGLRVKEIKVKIGDFINIGDILFTLDIVDLEEKIKEIQTEIAKMELQINTIRTNEALATEQKTLEEQRARQDYDEVARYMNTLVGRASEEVAKAKEALEEGRGSEEEKTLENALQVAVYAEADAKKERDQALKEAGRNVENILKPEESDASISVYQLEVNSLKEELNKYQQIIEKEGKVYADTSGVVTDIFMEAGGRVPDAAALLLSDDTVPYQFKVNFTKEQKKYINSQSDVKLKLDGIKELNVTLEHLVESPLTPGSFEGIITLPENIGMPGLSGNVVHSERGQKYDHCVSTQLIQGEKNREYVLVLEEKEGILGKEYYIRKVNVKILDQNESWAAIEGAISKDSLMIESTTEELENGEIVRWDK